MPKITVTEPNGNSAKYSLPLDKKEVNFGSVRNNHIVLTSSTVSSDHCKMIRREYGYEILDKNSTYGSSFNGEKFNTLKVTANKCFYISDVYVQIEFSPEEQAQLVNISEELASTPVPNNGQEESSENTPIGPPMPPDVSSYNPNETVRAIAPGGLNRLSQNPSLGDPPEPLTDMPKIKMANDLETSKESERSSHQAPSESKCLPEKSTNDSDPAQIDPNIEQPKEIRVEEEGYWLDFERNIEKAEIRTKFGGRPDWLKSPQWPTDSFTDEPYRFVCQIKIDPELFPQCEAKMAYFFLKDRESDHSILHETAVILQPGKNNHVNTAKKPHGPSLEQMVPRKGYKTKLFPRDFRQSPELVPVSQKDIDQAHTSGEPLNKIGGPPEFITSKNYPDSSGKWHLLFQLSKNTLPFELGIAENGVCYGFLNHDGKQCRMVVQRR